MAKKPNRGPCGEKIYFSKIPPNVSRIPTNNQLSFTDSKNTKFLRYLSFDEQCTTHSSYTKCVHAGILHDYITHMFLQSTEQYFIL